MGRPRPLVIGLALCAVALAIGSIAAALHRYWSIVGWGTGILLAICALIVMAVREKLNP